MQGLLLPEMEPRCEFPGNFLQIDQYIILDRLVYYIFDDRSRVWAPTAAVSVRAFFARIARVSLARRDEGLPTLYLSASEPGVMRWKGLHALGA